jgi:glycosyltransferase involved in cell wall biosynthesis
MAGLVVVSELPPARSEAAASGASLLRIFRRAGFRGVRADWPPSEATEASLAAGDLPVFHVTNDLEGREIYELALTHPGLVVLDDLALDRLVRGLSHGRDPLGAESEREAHAAADRVTEPGLPEPLAVPWCARLVRRARGVVVHSSFAARYLEMLGCRTPVFVAPHPIALPLRRHRASARRARRIRREIGRKTIVGAVGAVEVDEQLATLVDAAGRLAAQVVVIGRTVPGDVQDAAFRSAPGWVTVVDNLAPADLATWIRACDVVVDFGKPSTAEPGVPLLRALQSGVPAVVRPVGAVLELPDDAALRLPREEPSTSDLTAALMEVLDRSRAALATAGRAAIDGMAAEAVAAYAEAARATVALLDDPARWGLARWAQSLIEAGADDEGLAAGYGSMYAAALAELTSAETERLRSPGASG